MSWKKLLFGDFEHTSVSKDGKTKTIVRFEGGLLPAVVVLGVIGLAVWLILN